ncbi:hypothetical protein Murru_1134 [Allomuricauda ruestringensis DSM 13258]|uniref:Uncharacterized protein n=1 Tax=Allomuricauda ruestringensis (strain DSM 13258 / CIP 107369 / LMG 19739 / B1) TaxID=886377 RepID=G2PMS1_ALLRU|nr:hypothetical protein [Allomuricauda ruestringensis]AEM70178.1 hypothetical protein Murru_1134 [Allomuricauda ruestringensis DSM 13258]
MKNAFLLLAVTFMAYPVGATTTNEKPMVATDCHAQACQVAEQGAASGGNVNEIYELAYEMCESGEF